MLRLPPFGGFQFWTYREVREARESLYEYLRRPRDERATRRAPIDETLFYTDFINEPVRARCRYKCAFCEQKLAEDELVDHFRPIRDARDVSGNVDRDAYLWLSYDFDNLLAVCRKCSYNKSTYFPVVGERAPFFASLDEVRRVERPMLLDPAIDRIENHLQFLCDGWCEPLTDRGRVTLTLIGLNRPELVSQRARDFSALIEDLTNVIASGAHAYRLQSLFSLDLPFVGARLILLRRLLTGLTFRGHYTKSSIANLPSFLEDVLHGGDITERENRRLLERLGDLPSEDRESDHWDGDLGIVTQASTAVPDSPWKSVKRNGRLTDIQLRYFKGLEALDLRIPPRQKSKAAPCLVLLGENSTGKSSILQAIALGLIGSSQANNLKLASSGIIHSSNDNYWDNLQAHESLVRIQFEMNLSTEVRLSAEESKFVGNDKVQAVVLGYGPRRYFNPRMSARGRGAAARVRTLFQPNAALPDPEMWLRQLDSNQFFEVAQVLRVVLALNDEDEVIRDLEGRISVRISGKPTPLEWLSEGYRSLFAMIADILRELLLKFPILEDAEAIVLIDEIETHLHPRWKMRLMTALRRALPRVQFIVTTHDPLCLRGMDDGEVVVLQRTFDGSIKKLDGLPSIRGMRADQILTSDYFGLSSTIDPQSELELAKDVASVVESDETPNSASDKLIRSISVGNDAQEQVIHEAIKRFIAARERPMGRLRSDVRTEAVEAVLAALRAGDKR